MRDYLELGPVPFGEDCAQVGEPNYSVEAREQCETYRDMLKSRFPQWAQFNCNFVIKSFSHDFGRYFEVVIGFDRHDDRSVHFAGFVDDNLPEHWGQIDQLHLDPADQLSDIAF